MKKIILLLIFSIFILNAYSHKTYTSLTQINYNQKKERLEFVTTIFLDDLEHHFYENNIIYTKYFSDTINNYEKNKIYEYISDNFKIKINNKEKRFEFIGISSEDVFKIDIYYYILFKNKIKSIYALNTVLTQSFSEQLNNVDFSIDNIFLGRTIFNEDNIYKPIYKK